MTRRNDNLAYFCLIQQPELMKAGCNCTKDGFEIQRRKWWCNEVQIKFFCFEKDDRQSDLYGGFSLLVPGIGSFWSEQDACFGNDVVQWRKPISILHSRKISSLQAPIIHSNTQMTFCAQTSQSEGHG